MVPRLHQDPARVCRVVLALAVAAGLLGGCPAPDGGSDSGTPVFNNTTDPTNDGAAYIGSAACRACHPSVVAETRLHAHTHALKPISGQAPEYPEQGTRAGVPDPPAGFGWGDISYVISGYLHCAFFVDREGFVLTDGVAGVQTKWVLDFPPTDTTAGFVAFLPGQSEPLPYDHDTCFRCHTTGPEPQSATNPQSQDGRPGILGTWAEAGVQCEACHGPGSNHVPDPAARDIFVDSTAETCGRCHSGADDDPDTIAVEDGFLASNTQYAQLRASGGHSRFSCIVCHDPHASITYDRQRGLRNDCTACHSGKNMAFHEGAVFQMGDYVETVNCQSCHMPLAGRSAASAPAGLVGDEARIGDVRAHIFRIDTEHADADAMFTADGTAVQKDEQGRAAVTVDFVCLRCHHTGGNVFPLLPEGAAQIARDMHGKAAGTD